MKTYRFIDDLATFQLEQSDVNSYLYFPLVNEAGMMSVVTPSLHGDIKLDQNTFILPPVSVEDLHNTNSSRNFWLTIDQKGSWSATGHSAIQKASKFNASSETGFVVGGLLWHELHRQNTDLGIQTVITSFVPVTEDTVELNRVIIKNTSHTPIEFTPTVAVPLYCRSAGDIRDHRHVTSLLNRTVIKENGIFVKPTMCFDERGHTKNQTSYAVYGTGPNGETPCKYYPTWEEFIGEGGSFDWPEAVISNLDLNYQIDDEIDGYEAVGAFSFEKTTLLPQEEKSYIFAIAADKKGTDLTQLTCKYLSNDRFEEELANNKKFWEEKLKTLEFNLGDQTFNHWMKWVTLQPILRRIYGCSFLPHHDYGRGGRGWRDLWQDCLALLVMEPTEVADLLWNNFAGIRVDGSNATIIGANKGEFIADRNSIARVWMDHGAWPFLTTKLYIDRSGDLEFLLKPQTYFKDKLCARSSRGDKLWDETYGNKQKDCHELIYEGSILEHLLLQHLTAFYHVGEHNILKLEGADWNDAFDMGRDRGESVSFTALYASNLDQLGDLLLALKEKLNIHTVDFMKELKLLLAPVDPTHVIEKNARLQQYFTLCEHNISGEKESFDICELANTLKEMATSMKDTINENEWIENKEGFGWYNGYYDNCGKQVEGDFDSGVRMTLTGQVFSIMGSVANHERIQSIVAAADKYLYNEHVGGYRLNSHFNEVKLDLGRCFGFAFGHKENGAMFSHMAVMYANALYQRGFKNEGFKVLDTIYHHCVNFETSRIYPGIPEYINERGRGLYNYLTGSASWLLLTVVQEICGVKADLGDLILAPSFSEKQVNETDNISLTTLFADRLITFEYIGNVVDGKITSIKVGSCELAFTTTCKGVRIRRDELTSKVNNGDTLSITFA